MFPFSVVVVVMTGWTSVVGSAVNRLFITSARYGERRVWTNARPIAGAISSGSGGNSKLTPHVCLRRP